MPTKDEIQHILDSLLAKRKSGPSSTTFMGVPIDDFTREELIVLIEDVGNKMAWMLGSYREDIEKPKADQTT